MAHPYHHAVSTVRQYGGRAEDYLVIHSWFDRSKAYTVSPLHRVLRHHREGVQDAEAIFGETVVNADNVPVPVSAIGEQHCREDFAGPFPSFRDWLERAPGMAPFSTPHLPVPYDTLAGLCARRFGGVAGNYAPLVAWVLSGTDHNSPWTFMRRCHAAGIFDMEERFGLTVRAGDRHVPVRLVGETLVRSIMGGEIPSPAAWITALPAPAWGKSAVRLSRGQTLVASNSPSLA